MKLLQYSLDLYESLEAETGQAVDLHRCGSVRLAGSQDRLDEFAHRKGIADTLGVPFEIVSPERARELFPLMNPDGVVGAAYTSDRRLRRSDRRHPGAREGGHRRRVPEILRHTGDGDRARWRALARRDLEGRDPRRDRRQRRRAVGERSGSWSGSTSRSCRSSTTTSSPRDGRGRQRSKRAAGAPRHGRLVLRARGGRGAARRPLRALHQAVGARRNPRRLPQQPCFRPISIGSRTSSTAVAQRVPAFANAGIKTVVNGRTATRRTGAA